MLYYIILYCIVLYYIMGLPGHEGPRGVSARCVAAAVGRPRGTPPQVKQ